MIKYIPILSIFLVGCDVAVRDCNQENNEKMYKVMLFPPHGPHEEWHTSRRPWPDGTGYVFRLDDGREIQVSGSIIVEQMYEKKKR